MTNCDRRGSPLASRYVLYLSSQVCKQERSAESTRALKRNKGFMFVVVKKTS